MTAGTFTSWINTETEDDVEVLVEWDGYYESAKLRGAWEDSSPASGEMEILSVTRSDTGEAVKLTSAQEARMIEQAWEKYHDLH